MFSVSDDCHAHGSAHDIKHKNTYEFPEEKILAEEKRNMRIAFVGVGNISEIYLENITNMFREIEVIGVCDLIRERAEKAVEKYNIPKLYNDMYELFADDDVDIVLNITEAYNHYAVTKAALEAGKNVYSEKPLATTLEQGKELVRLAKEKGVRLGGAPDTFLGGGIQTCRRLIEDGYIGDVFGGSIHMICRGPEGWHPDPEAFYQPGAGPMFDMGPYYMTALANLLGRCSKITGFSGRAHKERIIGSGPRYGQKIPVNVDENIADVSVLDEAAAGLYSSAEPARSWIRVSRLTCTASQAIMPISSFTEPKAFSMCQIPTHSTDRSRLSAETRALCVSFRRCIRIRITAAE